MPEVPEGVQAQAPPDGAQPTTHRREAVPVLQVSQEILALRLLQSAYEPQVRYLQTLQRLDSTLLCGSYLNQLIQLIHFGN